jgi:cytochrome c oxidase cbb3-type subunit I/II
MKERTIDFGETPAKVAAMRRLGVPYGDQQIRLAEKTARAQAALVRKDLAEQGVEIAAESEIVALIAYLQRLGREPQFDIGPGGN